MSYMHDHDHSECLLTGKNKDEKTKKASIKMRKRDMDAGSSSCVEGSAVFTLDAVMRSFENPRGEYMPYMHDHMCLTICA